MDTMKAAVIYEPGGPEVLKVESRPIPKRQAGEVLIRVKAFGLNRSELFTRQGLSPGVVFPRVLGIEAVGLVEDAPGGEFTKGDIVATAMGGMGRNFDGAYAEYTRVPVTQVQVIKTSLPWETLGAIPEMLQTAWGSLFKSLSLGKGERVLIPRRDDIGRARRGRNCQKPRRCDRGDNAPARSRTIAAVERRGSSFHRYRYHRQAGKGGVSQRSRQGARTCRHDDAR